MEGHSTNKIDLSEYMEANEREEDELSNWDDIELPDSGLSFNTLPRKDTTTTIQSDQTQVENNDYSDAFSNSEFQLPLHKPSLDSVSKFLSSYNGPGTVTRLSGSKRSVSSEHSDWGEDIVIPQNGFSIKPRSISFSDDIDGFFGGEKDPGPSRASTFSRFSSLNSVEEEQFGENDFNLPDGKLRLQLSPHERDIPLELNFDGDDLDAAFTSDTTGLSSSKTPQKIFPPITPESSTEHWDDVAFPESMSTLKLAQRKPYRPSVNREEDWLQDIEVPNDNVFTIKAEQNRLLKRKSVTPAARILTRNAIKLDLYTLPNMIAQANSSNKTYSRKALRQKSSNDTISKRILENNNSLLNMPMPTKSLQIPKQTSLSSNSKPLVMSKLQYYGDGTELDEFDNLPVQSKPELRSGHKFQRLNPPKTESARESYSTLLSHFSEIEVVKSNVKTYKKKVSKPHLIKNLNSLKTERVVGDMRFNPRTQTWEGNEQALKDFDAVSPPRPALITNLNGSKRPRRVGNMIFDPEQMKWCSIVEEEDPFADIPDLTTADPEIHLDRKSQGKIVIAKFDE
ncbi:hypothetical protein K502DRAFT_329672 [Neoconidiobolus thromboides FSU 785]|nr:hypothetical protein K502DRAFT_329672 [Neoconidiobolus thromboides FSU 785]